MPTPPRRRWFQFGLGTMFLLVTLFALWLGWELSYVRERQAWLKRQEEILRERGNPPVQLFGILPKEPTVPFWRRWMGDKPQAVIRTLSEDAENAKRLFPEAVLDAIE